MKKIRVIELFAGVGGFRVGLESTGRYEVVWSNQWEPATKVQHASKVYEARFGKAHHSNTDINEVPVSEIPDADILVGGFPCQDYSVASTLKTAKGLIGKKGVLWWAIHRILSEKKNPPPYLLLENVDRLLKSPATQRGRDFAIMLKSLGDLGYAVEWRVINAAEYGMPQRRRRIFLLGYHQSTKLHRNFNENILTDWIQSSGILSRSFPVEQFFGVINRFSIEGSLVDISQGFNTEEKHSPFHNSGLFINGKVLTMNTKPLYHGPEKVLGDVLEKGKVSDDFYIPEKDVAQWQYLKGAKKISRTSANGHSYEYSEGSMVFPDALDQPARTIVTGEGGKSPSRFKHVVHTRKGLRRLTPLELERLNEFPDHHTRLEGISNPKRAFFMGNALVTGIVKRIGAELAERIRE